MTRLSIHDLIIVAFLAFAPALSQAESLTISLDEQPQWNAVGRLNKDGPEVANGCTATLIQPDLIITAGHCAPRHKPQFADYVFVAGWNAGRFAASSPIKDVYFHPDYKRGPLSHETVYADVALLRLEAPLDVAPMPVGRVPADVPSLAFLAYRNNGSQSPILRTGCQYRPALDAVTALSCRVAGGNSGAPVLDITPLGPRVVGVISARWGGGALAVDLQDWMQAYVPELPSSILE